MTYKKIKKFFYNYRVSVPKPYPFITQTLQSGMDIPQIIMEVNTLLPQLSDFINQFNSVVSQTGISVFTDSTGNMSIDVPQNMTDSVANNLSSRIGIIDRLINTRGQEINSLLQEGIDLENNLKKDNPNYVPKLADKVAEFRRLNESYKH